MVNLRLPRMCPLLLMQEALGENVFKAADGWDGSQYVFLTDGAGRGLFAIEVIWDSAAEAKEGAQGMAKWLQGIGYRDQGTTFTAADGRSAFLKTTGDRVYLAIGSVAEDLNKFLSSPFRSAAERGGSGSKGPE